LHSLDLALPRITLPSTVSDVGGYGVHYGDVDQNMHMNNTRYPDMYSNFLPLQGKMISKIAISYSNEAKMGEKLRVMRANEGNIFYFRTVRGDGKTNSEAEIELSDI
jgi:acyl-ACP thioesterase